MIKPLSYIELSKSNFIHNINQFRSILSRKNKLVAVVKANAYGHGLKEVVSITHRTVDYFQVDDMSELIEIRKYTDKPVLVFGYVSLRELNLIFELNAILGVYNIETLEMLISLSKKKKKSIKIHLKIDAFLGRQGILSGDIKKYIDLIKSSQYIELESVYSHFSNIEDGDGMSHANRQFKELMKVKEMIQDMGFVNLTHHISATSGFLVDQKKNWGSGLLRLGIGMYGLWPSESLRKKFKRKIKLKPVMRWVTKLAQVKTVPKDFPVGYGLTFVTKKETKIAVVPQGYSDGYDRRFSNNSFVLIRGKKCPVIGRVAMNMFVVDVSNISGVRLEDEVVLLDNSEKSFVSADSLAKRINTINYEVIARIHPLIDRIII